MRRQFREVPGLKEALLKASSGIPIPEGEDVLPESDKCVAISTRSSVREMIAPGLYAILAPLFVGFMVSRRGVRPERVRGYQVGRSFWRE